MSRSVGGIYHPLLLCLSLFFLSIFGFPFLFPFEMFGWLIFCRFFVAIEQ